MNRSRRRRTPASTTRSRIGFAGISRQKYSPKPSIVSLSIGSVPRVRITCRVVDRQNVDAGLERHEVNSVRELRATQRSDTPSYRGAAHRSFACNMKGECDVFGEATCKVTALRLVPVLRRLEVPCGTLAELVLGHQSRFRSRSITSSPGIILALPALYSTIRSSRSCACAGVSATSSGLTLIMQ